MVRCAATPFEAPATGPDEDLAVGVALLLLTRGPACLVAFDAPEDEFDAIEPDDPFYPLQLSPGSKPRRRQYRARRREHQRVLPNAGDRFHHPHTLLRRRPLSVNSWC